MTSNMQIVISRIFFNLPPKVLNIRPSRSTIYLSSLIKSMGVLFVIDFLPLSVSAVFCFLCNVGDAHHPQFPSWGSSSTLSTLFLAFLVALDAVAKILMNRLVTQRDKNVYLIC